MQYFTPRGEIPAKVDEQQVREVVVDTSDKRRHMYPHEYENKEKDPNNNNKEYQNFQPFEQRNRPEEVSLYEIPINNRVNLDNKLASLKQVQKREQEVTHRNDRARVQRNELNDPGAFRGIAAVEDQTGRNYGVAGVIYHPEGNPRSFARAPMEPLTREGRQYMRRFADDDGDHRVTTWPPRDEDANDLALYEDRFKKERKSKPKSVLQAQNKFFKK